MFKVIITTKSAFLLILIAACRLSMASGDPTITSTVKSCACEVSAFDTGACRINQRLKSFDWIKSYAETTASGGSSDGGQFFIAPFTLAASACAGKKLASKDVSVKWISTKSVVLEWR